MALSLLTAVESCLLLSGGAQLRSIASRFPRGDLTGCTCTEFRSAVLVRVPVDSQVLDLFRGSEASPETGMEKVAAEDA